MQVPVAVTMGENSRDQVEYAAMKLLLLFREGNGNCLRLASRETPDIASTCPVDDWREGVQRL